MNAVLEKQVAQLPTFGAPLDGGFYAGKILVAGVAFALIVAPKSEGQHTDGPWDKSSKNVPGAVSYFDGYQNTLAMADAGSKLARWALDLRIAGHDDWYLPSQDALELIYRNLKPGTQKNSCWARSGINLSAVPPTYPYTPDLPLQTTCEAFRTGGAEAMDEVWYWSSTQHAEASDDAWYQYFDDGSQGYGDKDYDGRARAVRQIAV